MNNLNLVFILLIFSIGIAFQMYFNRSFLLKILVITMLFIISSFTYFSIESYKGWPTYQKIKNGTLISVRVEEPRDEFKGAIYLWIILDPYEKSIIEKVFSYSVDISPRSYQLPYTQNTADEFLEANEKIKQGFVVKITENKNNQGDGKGDGEGEGDGGDTNGGNGTSDPNGNMGDIENYSVPNLKIISPDEILRK